LSLSTDLLEEANEKCAGLLGEKFRGLSRGLLPVGATRQEQRITHKRETKVSEKVIVV